MSRARDVVDVIARRLVDHPDEVTIDLYVEGDEDVLELTAHPGDLGKLIGRRGRTASAIRSIAGMAARLDGRRSSVEFLDD